ncbi:MAG: 4Fe-4S binding protein [Candidatus Hodarchaeota archaeon]
MGRPLWYVELVKKTFPSRFFLARLTHVPIIGKIVHVMIFHDINMVYLPQNKVIKVGKTVEDSGSTILPSQVVEHFVEQANYHWIMNFCICRSASKCEDYPKELGCLFLGEAVLKINPELGRQVKKEEALRHLKKCEEANLVHLVGKDKFDTMWLNIGPGEKLLTICNCCPCCCLWRMLTHVSPKIMPKVTKLPGVSVRVTETCIGCGKCTSSNVCFVNAIKMINKKAVITEECKGCGRCVNICPQNAIEISYNEESVEKTIDRMELLVDVT